MVAVETFLWMTKAVNWSVKRKVFQKLPALPGLAPGINPPGCRVVVNFSYSLGASLLDINVRSDGRCIVDIARSLELTWTKKNNAEDGLFGS